MLLKLKTNCCCFIESAANDELWIVECRELPQCDCEISEKIWLSHFAALLCVIKSF